jgi:hypothetical protein
MPWQALGTDFLVEHGPKELKVLFRVVVFQLSVPILLTDNDRHYQKREGEYIAKGKVLSARNLVLLRMAPPKSVFRPGYRTTHDSC